MKTFILFILFIVLWTICYSASTYILSVIADISWYESRTMGPSYIFLNAISIIIAGESTREFKNSAWLVRLNN